MATKSTRRPKRKARRQGSFLNKVIWFLVGIVFATLTVLNVANLIQGDESLFLRNKLNKQIAVVEESIGELKEQNRLKRIRIELLKNDPDIIEEEARQRLNLVKEGEELFILPNDE